MSGAVPIAAVYAGAFGLFAVLLANNVLYARLRAAVLSKWKPGAQLRVQANFVENVPLALVLLLALELQHVSVVALHVLDRKSVV